MTCPACGYKALEAEHHRCPRCGRRVEPAAPAAPPSPPPGLAAAAAPALAPDWKQEVAQRMEEFRNRHGRQRELFEEESGERVPPPDRLGKVLAYEDFAAARIEPIIVDSPPRPALGPQVPPARRQPRKTPAPPPDPPPAPQEVRGAAPVAPVAIRALAGALDGAVLTVAGGLLAGTFYWMTGAQPISARAWAGLGGALVLAAAFYVVLYVFFGCETPGMQWTGLRLVDENGNAPRRVQRLVRAAGTLLSAAALGLGYLWALIDEEGLTWHDRMSQTFLSRDAGAPRHFRTP
jgi:uncharacterized RDD family membrane protein YckC